VESTAAVNTAAKRAKFSEEEMMMAVGDARAPSAQWMDDVVAAFVDLRQVKMKKKDDEE
jgi:hypothetical protein